MLNTIRSLAENFNTPPILPISNDVHDDYLFALALAGNADYLVTGDKADVLALAQHGTTQIVTVRKLIQILTL